MLDFRNKKTLQERFVLRKVLEKEESQNRYKLFAIIVILFSGLAIFLSALLFPIQVQAGDSNNDSSQSLCKITWSWPVQSLDAQQPAISNDFHKPPQIWLSGHRGLDLKTSKGQNILAPSAGTISFVGKVGGKDVMSMRIGSYTATFEPAKTVLAKGQHVKAGEIIGTVDGISDHCTDQCLHWGVKISAHNYVNPLNLVRPYRIILKPETSS